jgi:hypothetical protein
MRFPTTALIWEIWHRNRLWVWLIIGIISFCAVFNLVSPNGFRVSEPDWRGALDQTLVGISFLLLFGVFNYSEFSQQKGWAGFPDRLFTLPVTSLKLVAVPIGLGLASVELLYWGWAKLIFTHGEMVTAWGAVLVGAFMVVYQAMLWNLAALGFLRVIGIGLAAITFIVIGFLPSFPHKTLWHSEPFLGSMLAVVALIAFLDAWVYIARQRAGARSTLHLDEGLAEQIADALPRRKKGFDSPAAAQFWFEWRRSGSVLPVCVLGLLVLVIGPLSVLIGDDPASTLRILVATFLMPVILALPIGKAFSKPEFWSGDLSFPSFLAVRPLATADMVWIKLKVAAVSAAISWLLVIAFLSVWLPLWANLETLTFIRVFVWVVYGHSMYPQYAIAALSILAGMFVTWRFLVGSLWLGLSGSTRLFTGSAIPYAFIPPVGLIGLAIVTGRRQSSNLSWIHNNIDRLLPALVGIAAVAVITKFWMAAFSWRNIAPQRLRQYCLVWFGGTLCLITLAMLLWAALRYAFPSDVYRLRSLLLLVALLIIPFARLGLAPSSLARNRHR